MAGRGYLHQPATIWSEGGRLAADIYRPDGERPEPGPAVLLCHGWGGLKSHLGTYGRWFARNGLTALVFDYRGWGESDGRIISVRDAPMLTVAGEQTLRVHVVREVQDPYHLQMDARNALYYLLGEDGVDPERVGIWGTSYGAGIALSVAAGDPRLKAVALQVGGYGDPQGNLAQVGPERARQKARGELDPAVPQGVDKVDWLDGTPDLAKMWGYNALPLAKDIRAPTLLIDAEKEELLDVEINGRAVFNIIRQNAVAEHRFYPCDHYGIYDPPYYYEASTAAVDWFKAYL